MEYDKPFDYKKANATRATRAQMNAEVDALHRARASQPPPTRPVKPGVATRVGSALTRPRSLMAGVKAVSSGARAIARNPFVKGAGLASFALPAGEAAINAASQFFGDKLGERENAIFEEGVQYAPNEIRREPWADSPDKPLAPLRPQKGVDGQPSTAETAPEPIERHTNPEAAVDSYTLANSAAPSTQLNAQRPQAIPNSDFQYAGRYGDNEVLTRPTKNGTEFTDNYTAFGITRPGQSTEAQAAEAARVAQAREDYERNTTGSDGRRYFGGPETEALRAAQLAQAGKGDPDGTVTRQLADEGRTPEQRAAYAADPAGSYNVDAQANSSAATAQLAAFKQQYDMNRNAKTDARLDRTAAMKEAGAALAPLKDAAPEAYSQLLAMAGEQFDPASGEPMSSVVQRLLSSLELDGGIPQVDENGRLVQKQQVAGAGAAPEIDAFF